MERLPFITYLICQLISLSLPLCLSLTVFIVSVGESFSAPRMTEYSATSTVFRVHIYMTIFVIRYTTTNLHIFTTTYFFFSLPQRAHLHDHICFYFTRPHLHCDFLCVSSRPVAPEGREGTYLALSHAPMFLGKIMTGLSGVHFTLVFFLLAISLNKTLY